jgi:hypothetical protein
LQEEVGTALLRCRFVPAIYNGQRTEVIVSGTVVLIMADGKPHLRIYMNQNHDDVAKGNDFIAPQLVYNSPDWGAARYHSAAYRAAVNGKNTWVVLSVTVDANGNQKELKISAEEPPGFGVGTAAKDVFFAKDRWVPGFRNGHPVECTFDFTTWIVTFRIPIEERP